MKKQISKLLLVPSICIMLLTIIAASAQAQGLTPTPTPGTTATPTATPVVQLSNPNVVTFAQLRQGEIQLNGPYDSTSFSFAAPANWSLQAGASLDLLIGVSFNTNVAANGQGQAVMVGGGTLTVLLNNVVLSTVQLNQLGELDQKIAIPQNAFNATRSDSRMVLRFVLDSGSSCSINGIHTVVFLHPTSFLTLPHTSVAPSTSLLNFPRPIYQNSFTPDRVLIVIPDQPTSSELQAALTTGAGLSKLSFNRIILDMITLSNFKTDYSQDNHLVFVGKAGSLPQLSQLQLPEPVANGQFQLPSDAQDDGLVEMIDSPWSSGSEVILVISGNTDQGVVKAAQAVTSGILRTNRSENLSIIDQVSLIPVSSPQPVDQSLADLGYQGRSFQTRGGDSDEYVFNVPAGMTIGSDAYFELVYGHSALIDYNSSQIVVLVNDQPIGSVRMSDATASNPVNQMKFTIPSSVIIPGKNRITVQVNLVPLSDCTPPNVQGLWVNIWPQSMLHIPLLTVSVSPNAPQNLSAYPAPFIYDPVLGTTAFVLEKNDLESWRNALQIAAFLGSQSSGPLVQLSAFYGDQTASSDLSKYNLLVMGRASQLPIVSELNKDLPAPFSVGSDVANESNNFQVDYRIPPDSPMGYIETILSPWNSNNVVLAMLGNTTQGVSWAASALINPTLRSRLAGNFAVINNQQILTSNARFESVDIGAVNPTKAPPGISQPQTAPTAQTDVSRPLWILPIFIVILILIVVVILTVVVRRRPHAGPRKSVVEDTKRAQPDESSDDKEDDDGD